MSKPTSVNRVDFIVKLKNCGFGYVKACRAYEAMISVFEDAVIQGHKINLGKLASLTPVKLEPKVVHMGFRRKKGIVEKVQREYILGRRIRYRFVIHKSFLESHPPNWM